MFYGGRSIEEYSSFAELGYSLWVFLWHHLSPVSKACPPNGAQVLVYFGRFNAVINAHKDMNPDMAINPNMNSQVIGSSVMVVTLLDSMRVEFCTRRKLPSTKNGRSSYTHDMVDMFDTEDCSVYVQDPNDDLEYFHRAQFLPHFWKVEGSDGKNKQVRLSKTPKHGRVHVAITYRWLGKRTEFFGKDHGRVSRQNCQVIHNAETELNKIDCAAKREGLLKILKRKR